MVSRVKKIESIEEVFSLFYHQLKVAEISEGTYSSCIEPNYTAMKMVCDTGPDYFPDAVGIIKKLDLEYRNHIGEKRLFFILREINPKSLSVESIWESQLESFIGRTNIVVDPQLSMFPRFFENGGKPFTDEEILQYNIEAEKLEKEITV